MKRLDYSSVSRNFIQFLAFPTLLGLIVLGAGGGGLRLSAAEPLIGPRDRVALVGGTLIESLQSHGDCEALVLLSQPTWKVSFRNLGWSGDDVDGVARRVFGSQSDGYARLMQDLQRANPTVVVLGYGFAEASNGSEDLDRFRSGLRRQIEDYRGRSIRVILMQPFALPGIRVDRYAETVAASREIVQSAAAEFGLAVIDPLPAVSVLGENAFDAAGLRLSRGGQKAVGAALAAGLLGDSLAAVQRAAKDPRYGAITERIAEKNGLFFHHHRPMNETYLFLFRKHEQGNNAVEVDQFVPLVEEMESRIWSSVQSSS